MARTQGFNVGVDALHRPEADVTDRCVEWNGGNMTFPHLTGGTPRSGTMEGIVPYIPSGVHAIQLGVLNPSDCGRLVAAPTVVPNVCHSTGCGWENLLGGTMWASSPTFRRGAYHSTRRVESVRWRAAGSRPYWVAGVHAVGRGALKPSAVWGILWNFFMVLRRVRKKFSITY